MNRTDVPLKLAGQAEFGMDLSAPGMLWGALIPSPSPHGRIRQLDLGPVRDAPGVVAAVGPAEVRRLFPGGSGDPERPLFPPTQVMYLNQPIAAVAARTQAEARAAARRARVSVDPLPIIADIESAFPDWPSSSAAKSPHVIAHVRAGHGDVAAAFSKATLVHSETYRTAAISQVALEPHAALAMPEEAGFRVRTSTQTPFGVREDAASILGIGESSLTIEGTWVGGGFGGKGAAFLEPYAVALAAASRRPVRVSLSYREEFLLGRSTLPSVIRLDTAVAGGRIVGRRVRLLLDTGASLPGRDFATGYAIGFLLGPYQSETFEVEGYAVRTNKPPFGPHRAPFAPQCVFAAESHLDGLARRLGVDPVEFRRKHLWTTGSSTAYGQKVGPFGLSACLEAAGQRLTEWRASLPANHGVGIAAGFWSTNAGAGGEARVRLDLERLVIQQGEREIGSGSVIAGLPAVAARATGLPVSRIQVEYLDTRTAPFDSGVFGSRTVGALGQAVNRACAVLLAELKRRARTTDAVSLAADSRGITVVVGRKSRPLSELLNPLERREGLLGEGRHYAASGKIDESRVKDGTFYPYTDFTGACHVAEVEVDRETGRIRVVRYAAFHDVGVALDPQDLIGQVEGGVVMGLGEALTEEGMWGPEGRLENPTLLDYRIPTLSEVPAIAVELIEGFPGAGPFGAKGMGEPPVIPVPAAVANAVADATGVRILELPLSAERVARTLKLL